MDNAKTSKAIYREGVKSRERANPYDVGIRFAQILGIGGFSEEVRLTSFPTRAVVNHPFVSISSWIRGMPELGATVSAQYSKENNEAVIVGYRQLNPQQSIQAYSEGNSLYQELLPGELDFMSSGMSHSFKASRPLDVREAGLTRSILDGDTSSILNKAVTFVDTLHQNEAGTIKDTRRFGVVRRPKNSVETKIIRAPKENSSNNLMSSVASAITGDKEPFAKENSLILVTKDGYLLDYREGNVIDDDGSAPINSWTGNNLRVRKKFYTVKQDSSYVEIDCYGNIDVYLPEEAEKGFRANIAKGSVDVKVGDNLSIISTKDSLYKADGTSTLTVGGFLTNLGQDGKASHPLLFGDEWIKEFMQFLIALSKHVHPGISVPSPDLASSCIDLASKCPNFVSTNVQTQ